MKHILNVSDTENSHVCLAKRKTSFMCVMRNTSSSTNETPRVEMMVYNQASHLVCTVFIEGDANFLAIELAADDKGFSQGYPPQS